VITNGLLLKNRSPELSKSSSGGRGDLRHSSFHIRQHQRKTLPVLPKVSRLVSLKSTYLLLRSKLIARAKNGFRELELIDMVKMLKEVGCKGLIFNIYTVLVDSNDLSEMISQDDDFLYSQFIDACKNKLKGVSVNGYKGSFSLPHKFAIYFQPPFSLLNSSESRICMRPWCVLDIDTNGNTIPCCRFQQRYHKPLCDNVFKDGEEIVNSQECMKMRKSLLNKNLPLAKECINCSDINSYGSKL
jgi:MoaA/NifB/PqqE/SkfB family radical SAM enzyme